MEGWASFAESYLLADEYGVDTERRFWDAQREAYESGRFDGTTSILSDGTNGGVAYSKGAWILRMLRDDLGEPAFLSGMREYLTLPAGSSTGIPAFAAALSRASGRDVGALLLPWLEETTIPNVRARIDDNRVILRQDGPLFDLPIELDIVTSDGRVRRTVRLARREIVIEGLAGGSITAVTVDPDRRLLLKR